MKILTTLAIAQLLLLVVLFLRVMGLEEIVAEISPAPLSTASTTPLTKIATAPDRAPAGAAIDEQQLRLVVREELNAQLAGMNTAPTGGAEAANGPDLQMQIEFDHRRTEVEQSIDYYAQVGRISETEMLRLQSEIAKLRPEDRRAMFGRLVRELNNGVIDGRL